MPDQGLVIKFQNGTEKRDCVEAKNYFQVGTESAIKSVKMSIINEAGVPVMMHCFQIETESEIKSVETSKINDAGVTLMRCCSQIETESEIDLV